MEGPLYIITIYTCTFTRNFKDVYKFKMPRIVLIILFVIQDMVHYEVVIQEAINGESPAVGIATCSPLKPSPTCSLLRDYFRWKADGKGI